MVYSNKFNHYYCIAAHVYTHSKVHVDFYNAKLRIVIYKITVFLR